MHSSKRFSIHAVPFMKKRRFPFYKQHDQMDCGPTCIKMIADFYGKEYSLQSLREKCYFTRDGVSLKGMMAASENIGLQSLPVKIPFSDSGPEGVSLVDIPLPCIAHWDQKHFVVVYKISNKYVWLADPAQGKLKVTYEVFKKFWISDEDKGVALLFEPTPLFYEKEGETTKQKGFSFLFNYLRPYKWLLVQIVIGLLIASLLQLVLPFLTQSIVDIGIGTRNLEFIYLILLGQLMIFVGSVSVYILQQWLSLHISTRINISLISDFLFKLTRLPIKFFETKMIGDLLQRITDHQRIEAFLTTATLNAINSMISILSFGIVLFILNFQIFLIFVIASGIYFLWISLFLKKRREIDFAHFREMSNNQDALIEIIQGMQEIKLQNSEHKHRLNWKSIQTKLFRVSMRALSIAQWQEIGANGINQLKDIFISFIAATAVVKGDMTLGMMMAVQFIIGQLNVPLQRLVGLIQSGQDAKISLERLGEIHDQENEEGIEKISINTIPEKNIVIENMSFQYTPITEVVLEDINLTIPRKKVTAIVGVSGSGKTTLVKLLLGFYQPTAGTLKIGDTPIENISQKLWRQKCGAVLQDGYVFSNTIANNIAESDDMVDQEKLLKAVEVANIKDFIESLSLGYNTMIGAKGNGVSQGQKQRMLIARAVYKDPEFIFFDEATNALDANNERVIMKNLDNFFKGRTVIVVAHRLSTVKNADQIVVLHQGRIVETGTHEELVAKRGEYYVLIKNQLELGS